MTEKLLAFSRKKITYAEIVDIKTLIENDEELLAKSLTAAVRLKLDLSDETWSLWADPSELQNMLLNMSINARHAMPYGGLLNIKTRNEEVSPENALKHDIKAGDYVLLSIADTGFGMDSETLSQVFDPFFSTKGENGTGLGLSQVFGFVKASGGMIELTSDVGVGTQFDIYFPRYKQTAKVITVTDEIIPSDRLRGDEKILIVDDEAALRAMLKHILSAYGYQVIVAENGEQALQLLAQHVDIRLMLSDVVMPKMNGIQLAEKVSQQYPHIAIQLVSGYTDTLNLENDKQALLTNLLHKPYRKDSLLQRVRYLLDN